MPPTNQHFFSTTNKLQILWEQWKYSTCICSTINGVKLHLADEIIGLCLSKENLESLNWLSIRNILALSLSKDYSIRCFNEFERTI